MKRILIAAVAGVCGLIACGAGPATQPANDLQHENAMLRQLLQDKSESNRDLQQRVHALDQEIRELKRRLAEKSLTIRTEPEWNSPLNPYRAPLVPSTPEAPPGSVKREFNGMPYYVMPLTLKAVPPSVDTSKWPIGVEYHRVSGGTVPEGLTVESLRKQMPAEIVPPELLNPSK